MQTQDSKVQCGSVIVTIYFIILCVQSIPYVDSSLSDLSIVPDGYDFDDYVPAHQNRPDGPWIVSTFPGSDYAEKPFRSTINVDYSTLDTSSANHHGNINHINSQFGSTFIPAGIVDNSHLNSHPIRVLCVPNHHNNMKCIDAVSGGPKPFNGYLKHTIRSVHGPFNSNMPARSPFSRPRRIYPVHVPIVKRPTIRDITNSAVKKIPFYMEKFSEPLHPSDKIMFSVYKKKRRIFQRSN